MSSCQFSDHQVLQPALATQTYLYITQFINRDIKAHALAKQTKKRGINLQWKNKGPNNQSHYIYMNDAFF